MTFRKVKVTYATLLLCLTGRFLQVFQTIEAKMKMQELKLRGQQNAAVAKTEQPCSLKVVEVRLARSTRAFVISSACLREPSSED